MAGVIVVMLFLPRCAGATEAMPYYARRVSPMHSDWYAVISGASGERDKDPIFGPVAIRIVKSQIGAPHARPGIAFSKWFRHSYSHDVSLRTGDIVVGQFQMEAPPVRLLVSAMGHGVIGLGVRPPDPHVMPNGFVEKNFLVVASSDASLLHRKSAESILGRARQEKRRIAGILGETAKWIDETNARALFVWEIKKKDRKGTEWVIESISLKDWTVKGANITDVLDSLSQANAASLPAIVHTAIAMNLLGEPTKLRVLLSKGDLSKSERIAVAAFLAHSGASDGIEAVYAAAKSAADRLSVDPTFEERVSEALTLGYDVGFDDHSDELLAAKLAVEFLPECVGDNAMPVLKRIVAHSAPGGVMNESAKRAINELRVELQR